LEPALRALAARERRALDDHPTPETLGAYRDGELPPDAAETLRDHLALCPDCAEMLLDFATFEQFTPPEESASLTDSDVGAAWQRMQQRLAPVVEVAKVVEMVETPEAAPVVAQEKKPAPLPFVPRASEYEPVVLRRRLRTAYAIAATLAVGVVGLSMWGGVLQGRLRDLSKPRVNLGFVYAFSEDNKERGESSGEVLSGKTPVLVIEPTDLPPADDYGVEVRNPGGALILKTSGLVPSRGSFSMELPSAQLSPGSYRVELFGVTGSGWQKLDTLSFQIGSPTPAPAL
jgi:hypothetical protein